MARITRIKASDTPRNDEAAASAKKKAAAQSAGGERRKPALESTSDKRSTDAVALKSAKSAQGAVKVGAKPAKAKQEAAPSEKKPFILVRPLVYFGRYLRDSWKELRQVRWPNRKATWKMVLAVIVYTAIFMALITLLDMFFTWLFSLIIK